MSGIRYTNSEMETINNNLDKGSSDLALLIEKKHGTKRTPKAINRVCQRMGWKIKNIAQFKPAKLGHVVIDRGRKTVKTISGYKSLTGIQMGAGEGEVTTTQNGEVLLMNRAVHGHMILMDYYKSPQELKKSIELIARVNNRINEVI